MRPAAFSLCLIILLTLGASAWLSFSGNDEKRAVRHEKATVANANGSEELVKLQSKAFNAKLFIRKNGFDTSCCLLIDMSLPANRKRFFVYDLRGDTVAGAGLVTHGNCNQYWLEGRKYGNDVGCGCTSLGKYRIGTAYRGRFGLAFKLYGLDATNSNAYKRFVVLHAHSCVPENETEENICQSNGCPTVSPSFLKQLEPVIKRSAKPLLLWIFD